MITIKLLLHRFLLSCILILLGINVQAQGAISTIGKDFWLGFMNNYDGLSEERALQLIITGSTATTGTVSVPLQGWDTTFTITPNTTTTVTIPNNIAEHFADDVVDTRAVHVESLDAVSLFAINSGKYSADGTIVYPVKYLGSDYMISSFAGTNYGIVTLESEFLIVATADATQIEITPTSTTAGGHVAGVSYIIDLNEGESYQVYADRVSSDLTGTTVKATTQSGECRPFAVFSGSQVSVIPDAGCQAGDHLYNQLSPVNLWGSEYYWVPYSGSNRYSYTIIARDNGTVVTVNNGVPITMSAGQVLRENVFASTGAFKIVANNPICVTQFMNGATCTGQSGDPSMLVLNSEDQRINSVTFSTVISSRMNRHFLNIIVETSDVGTVLFDNVSIPSSSFRIFSGAPTKSYVQFEIYTEGTHSLFAPNGCNAYLYGIGSDESYSFAIGSVESLPASVIDSLPASAIDSFLCITDSILLVPDQLLSSPVWTTLSDTSTVIGTGNSLLIVPPIINEVYIVTGNSLASGCPHEYLFSVASSDSIIFTINPIDTNICRFNDVQMGVSLASSGLYEYSWSPAYLFDNPSSASPVLTAEVSGWVYVTLSNIGGACSSTMDSLYVEVIDGGIKDLTVSTNLSSLCFPETAQLSFELEKVRLYEDFNGGINPTMWTSTSGVITSNLCGAYSGNALYFNGGSGLRIAATTGFDVSLGGTVSFYVKAADGVYPCEATELGDDLLLQYSINGGLTWILMATLLENAYPNLSSLSFPIPNAAQTTSTRFRWRQQVFEGADLDIWILDNVIITAIDNSNLNFSWSPAVSLSSTSSLNPLASPTDPTWFSVDIDDGGCIYSDSVFIDMDLILTTSNDTTLCVGQGAILNTIPSKGTGHTYLWTPPGGSEGSLSIAPLVTTTYYVTVTSPQGCIQEDSINVIVTGIPELTLPLDTTMCPGSTYLIQSSCNLLAPNYLWSTTDTLADLMVNREGLYWLEVSTVCGSDRDSITITNFNPFTVDLGNDTNICAGDSLNLAPSIPIGGQATWFDGSNNTTFTVTSPSSISVIIQDVNGCEVKDSIHVAYSEVLTFDLGQDFSVCGEDIISLSYSNIQFDSIVWNDGTNTDSYTYNASFDVGDTIALSVIAYGCSSVKDTIKIYVEPCACPVFVPNTFTPNNDKHNNLFKIYHHCVFKDFNFIIFDRWGEVIYETQSPNFEWDGNFRGVIVKSEHFAWRMKYLLSNDSEKNAAPKVVVGHLNVLR